jgi:hypothetical protein
LLGKRDRGIERRRDEEHLAVPLSLVFSVRSWLEEIVPDGYGCALALIHACHF